MVYHVEIEGLVFEYTVESEVAETRLIALIQKMGWRIVTTE